MRHCAPFETSALELRRMKKVWGFKKTLAVYLSP
jgi:hypothetical protein